MKCQNLKEAKVEERKPRAPHSHPGPAHKTKISPSETLAASAHHAAAGAGAAGRAPRGGLLPPPAGRARAPPARLRRQQGLARPHLRPSLPCSLPRLPWSSPHAGYPNSVREVEDNIPHFFPTTKFRARIPDDDWGGWGYAAWDCRHGRVLLGDGSYHPVPLVVWDPITGRRRELDQPSQVGSSYGAAVLCAVAGCDHRVCHAGPFQVAYIGIDTIEEDGECFASACLSLPMSADWSKPCSETRLDKWGAPCSALRVGGYPPSWDEMAPVFVQGALYVNLMYYQEDDHIAILKYDLVSNCLSLIDPPLAGSILVNAAILMAMEDGSLGFAHVDKVTLHLWSRQTGSDGIASWTQRSVINLNNHLPIQNPDKRLRLIGSLEGSDTIFVTMGLDIYEINLKTLRWKKLQKKGKLSGLIPYMSFYNPQERVIPSDAAQ